MYRFPPLGADALALICTWQNETHTTPSWDEYFLKIAFDVAERSPDRQTQHGAVIVSASNEIIATGYNGTIRDIDNTILPKTRPEKYPWMIHAEHNAILACARQGKSTLNTKIYVTGEPCDQCYQYIWQVGIKRVIYGNHPSNMNLSKDIQLRIEIFKWLTGYLSTNPLIKQRTVTGNELIIRHVDFPKKV